MHTFQQQILPFDSDEEDSAKPMTYDEKRQLSLDIKLLSCFFFNLHAK